MILEQEAETVVRDRVVETEEGYSVVSMEYNIEFGDESVNVYSDNHEEQIAVDEYTTTTEIIETFESRKESQQNQGKDADQWHVEALE
ncbi:hypothetical protein [Candidatus Nanohalococcus occultus]|uniref:Uncharacterized protein n=1 Tax=Candidatus Nanohalococcus occultus TaxID=2978047 RepID=A0ABY8CGP3_9ARCH|nr:hypothetical protein SVXNc_0646 [Candidatus Nanohaloarchaeota archaeon SVXNc]